MAAALCGRDGPRSLPAAAAAAAEATASCAKTGAAPPPGSAGAALPARDRGPSRGAAGGGQAVR